jgi:uncharacterized protein
MAFLRAEWRKLALANYDIDPEILKPHVPFGTELDVWEGRCYVSVVGFMFLNTKLLGVPVPWHTNFVEVNLRFYVRRMYEGEWRRGAVFISEIVPRHAITMVANILYNEHYRTMPMRHSWLIGADTIKTDYSLQHQKKWHNFEVTAVAQATEILVGSEAEFITEHYYGYTSQGKKHTTEYEVRHPRWEQYEVQQYKINMDFEQLYGPAFGVLNEIQPISVMLAEGSKIEVMGKLELR